PISFSNVSRLRPRGLQKFCWGRSVFPASLARPRSTIRVPPAPVRTPTGSPGECCRRQQRFRFLPVRTSSSWRIFSSNRFVSSPERPSSRSKAGSLQPLSQEYVVSGFSRTVGPPEGGHYVRFERPLNYPDRPPP